MRVSTKFDIAGIEPQNDPAWDFAADKLRREFWRVVVRLVKDANEFERARGRDRFGRKLTPISRYTRAHRRSAMGPADPNAPPLTPADGASRTVAYFDGRAHADHAEFFYRNGWGKILNFHRIGAGRLPVRDVIGISPASLRKVTGQALAWWQNKRQEVRMPPPLPPPVREPAPLPVFRYPKPKPIPRPKVAASPIRFVPKPTGQRRSGKILVYTEKKLTGPPTIGEAMTGARFPGRRAR